MPRVPNRSFKTEAMQLEGLQSIDEIYTLRDAGRRFGVARSTIVRWVDMGLFPVKRFVFRGQTVRYCTEVQCCEFEQSDFYKALPPGREKMYAKVSSTIHDFMADDVGVVFTVSEFAEKIGLSLQSVNRMDRSGVLRACRTEYNNRIYRYYNEEQYNQFVLSDRYKQLNHVRHSDLIGTKVGKLTVLSFSDAAVRKGYYGSYLCECDCGNIVGVSRSELLTGKVKSCGCKFHDLTGRVFGWWHVDGLSDFAIMGDGQRVFRYDCTCVCGKKAVVFAGSLRQGHSQSCGCITQPFGELHISKYLQSLGLFPRIDDVSNGYDQHKTYVGLVGMGGNRLSYDFYVKWDTDEWLIEYQGAQHYRAVDYFGGDVQFEKQKEHDFRKRIYAEEHGLTLIEISYKYSTYEEIANVLKRFGIC